MPSLKVVMPVDVTDTALEAQENVQPQERPEELRLLEAMLFASAEPLDEKSLAARLPHGVDLRAALARLQEEYATRGVNLVRINGKWTFRTANDLSWLLSKETVETRKLSRAAIETLAIIAYHQPVTRAEIEDIRGVTTSKGSVDVLLETGWIRPRGRRKSPGRPVTYGTSAEFLSHFGLDAVGDLPGLDELKGSGLLRSGRARSEWYIELMRRKAAELNGSNGLQRVHARLRRAVASARRRLRMAGVLVFAAPGA
jgi:segregation and condensation protein B